MAIYGIRFRYILAGSTVLSAAAGSAVTYVFTKKQLDKKLDTLISEEVEKTRQHYAKMYKKDEYASLDNLAAPIQQYEEKLEVTEENMAEVALISEIDYNKISRKKAMKTEPSHSEEEWDQEAEDAKRELLHIYPISHEEFVNTELETQCWSYFEDDDVMVGQEDALIDGYESLVGDDAVLMFGYGSKSNNVVYIRNENIGMDFEIVRHLTGYSASVLGLSHSDDSGKIRKFRGD
jgi:hypothetical protein